MKSNHWWRTFFKKALSCLSSGANETQSGRKEHGANVNAKRTYNKRYNEVLPI